MKHSRCSGCFSDKTWCSLLQHTEDKKVINNCPCSFCIVKIKCRHFCNNYFNYLKNMTSYPDTIDSDGNAWDLKWLIK